MKSFLRSTRGFGIGVDSLFWVAYIPADNCLEGKIDNALIAFLLNERVSSAAGSLVRLLLHDKDPIPAFQYLENCGEAVQHLLACEYDRNCG